MKSFKQWASKKWKEWNTPYSKDDKHFTKQYDRIADWTFVELSKHHTDETIDRALVKTYTKKYTKVWFAQQYSDEHYKEVLKRVERKIGAIGLGESIEDVAESRQMGGSRGRKRSKEEEMEIANQSPIYRDTKYEGWKIKSTIHAAAQAYDRRPGFEFDDWKKLHRKAIQAMKKANKMDGDFIVFSKSMEQGYVFSANSKRKSMRIITVLPKGRRNPKPGTDLLMVESRCRNAEYLEVE